MMSIARKKLQGVHQLLGHDIIWWSKRVEAALCGESLFEQELSVVIIRSNGMLSIMSSILTIDFQRH